jgi:hypothetical protein
MLRLEFGNFNKHQIRVITQLVLLISQAVEFQKEKEMDSYPDVVFDSEGKFKLVTKVKPIKEA